MSYSLFLVQVPPGASDEDVEKAALAANDFEIARPPAPPDPAAESRKRALVEALLQACPELEGGELDYSALAQANGITENEARQRFRSWEVVGPEDGAGIQITLYDTFVSIDMAVGGTDQDWQDLWRYLEILAREGGFTIWDPQGPNVLDLAAGPFGDGTRKEQPKRKRRRTRTRGPGATKRAEPDAADDGDGPEGAEPVEDEDTLRGGEVGKLINRIVSEAIADPLAAAGYRRSGRTWRRYLEDGVVQVVNVQWSPRNQGVEGWFTLNAGVYFPALARSLATFPVTTSPKEYDCHVRRRPLPPGISGWTVRVPGIAKPDPDIGEGIFKAYFSWLDRRADRRAGEQHERATRELRLALERHAFPWLERVSTLRGARDEFVQRGAMFWAAHASLMLGERDEAARILERELAKANPEYVETLRAWGRANGLMT